MTYRATERMSTLNGQVRHPLFCGCPPSGPRSSVSFAQPWPRHLRATWGDRSNDQRRFDHDQIREFASNSGFAPPSHHPPHISIGRTRHMPRIWPCDGVDGVGAGSDSGNFLRSRAEREIVGISDSSALPEALCKYVAAIESALGVRVDLLSTGPGREEILDLASLRRN